LPGGLAAAAFARERPKANPLFAAEFMAAGGGGAKGESRRNGQPAVGGGGGKAVRLGQEMRSKAP